MFIDYSYFRQYTDGKEISDYKEFYRKLMDERGWGGGFSHIDYLVKYRFLDIFGYMFNILLRKRPKKVIDIGCGNGMNLPLSNLLPDMEYHGLDYSAKAVEIGQQLYPNIRFHKGDAFHTQLPAKSFDLAISSYVVVLYKEAADRIALLREARRVLKDDGVLVLITMNEAWGLKICIRLGFLLGRLRRLNLPKDFMAVYLSYQDVKNMVGDAGLYIEERVNTSSLYGILDSVRYLNMSKFNRTFGKSESEATIEHPQNVLLDLQRQAGRFKPLVRLFYFITKAFPGLFAFNSIYVCRPKLD